jgi:hypothetical protein
LEKPASEARALLEDGAILAGLAQSRRWGKSVPPYRQDQTLSRARPFARRARITAAPERVRMRTRKPWVRFRRMTDGW